MAIKKKEFTIKKTGYVLKSETVEMCLGSMGLRNKYIRQRLNFIFSSVNKFRNVFGMDGTPKKVSISVTVKMIEE